MVKKNGFIATSILYSLFLVFLTLFLALILMYLHNQILLQNVNEEAMKNLSKINNTKISNLNMGDYVQFMDDPVMGESYNDVDPNNHDLNEIVTSVLNQTSKWIVAYIETNGSEKTYYFFSDLDASILDIQFKTRNDLIRKYHALTINIADEMNNVISKNNENLYQQSIQFKNYKSFQMSFPTSSILAKIRNDETIEDEKKNSIYGIDGSYIIYIDEDIGDYEKGEYYNYRMYSFTLENSKKGNILKEYCNGTFSSNKVEYATDNKFGYMNKVWDTVSNDEYIDYCSYASRVSYSHKKSDLVVTSNETKDNDIAQRDSSNYNFRLMLKLSVDENDELTYVSGGSGDKTNPYIIMDGVKNE